MKSLIAKFCFGAALCAPAMFGQFTDGIIDIPGSVAPPLPTGIDALDQIAGGFKDAAGTHGFLLSRGVFAQVSQANSSVYLLGINNVAGAVGYANGSTGDLAFFDGQRAFKYPRGGTGRRITGINASSTFVGYGTGGAFINVKGVYTTVVPAPCASFVGPVVIINGINASNDFVGTCYDSQTLRTYGFARIGGVDQSIAYLGDDTYPTGINDSGVIAGYYYNPTEGHYHSFTYSVGQFTPYDYPSVTDTFSDTRVTGINNKGSLVGNVFAGSQNQAVGFYHIAN